MPGWLGARAKKLQDDDNDAGGYILVIAGAVPRPPDGRDINASISPGGERKGIWLLMVVYCGDIKDDDAMMPTAERDNLTLAAIETLFCTIVDFGFCDDNLKPKNTLPLTSNEALILFFFFLLHLDILMPPMQPQPCSSLAGPKHCKYTFLHLPACLYQSPSQCSFHFFCFVRKKQEMI